jgi:hypothetical protein
MTESKNQLKVSKIEDDQIRVLRLVANPDKLRHVDR